MNLLQSAGMALAMTLTMAGATANRTEGEIAAHHREWILVGWEKKPGDRPFDFRRQLGRFYDLNARNLMLYDDFEPQQRVARSADEYGSFWAQPFTALRSAKHAVVDGPSVLVSDSLAASTLEFTARLEHGDGRITAIRTRSSLVWKRQESDWKIVREHNSSTVISEDELDRLNAAAAP